MNHTLQSKIMLIGIGHPDRGDDALGSILLENIKAKVENTLATQHILGDMAQLIDCFEHYHIVIIIDAIVTRQKPIGTCYRFENEAILPISHGVTTSTHSFDLGQTLQLAKNLGVLPNKLILYGIEVGHFEHGKPMSEAVTASLSDLEQSILKEIRNLQHA